MRIKAELLWGDSIQDKRKLYDLLQAGELPSGYYVLLLTSEGKLEFIPSRMMKNRYFQTRDCVVFGLARDKKEATEMICDILTQIYAEHMYESVAHYAGEVLGEPVC